MAAKVTEKMLYGLFLDLWYADRGYAARIEELTDELKDAKVNAKKTKKLLEAAEKQYAELNNGNKPRPPK